MLARLIIPYYNIKSNVIIWLNLVMNSILLCSIAQIGNINHKYYSIVTYRYQRLTTNIYSAIINPVSERKIFHTLIQRIQFQK